MAQFTQKLLGSHFAVGGTHYQDFYPGSEMWARVVVRINIEHCQEAYAIVDTGAQWSVFDPVLVQAFGIDLNSEHESRKICLMVRGTLYEGRQIRVDVTLKADYGEDLTVDATVFVPTLDPDDVWPWPNFLGLEGLLDRMRFAVDPTENAFYFGPV